MPGSMMRGRSTPGRATGHVGASAGIETYYYRGKARNQWRGSPWSHVRTVAVRWELEPDGEWLDALRTGAMQPSLR